MKDYFLAKLISSVEVVDSRKRLQKSIYLLQRAGCPLKFDYILHYYGPYSFELAGLIDQLKSTGIISEDQNRSVNISQYMSEVTEKGRKALKKYENLPEGKGAKRKLSRFIVLFENLNKTDSRQLELAATAAYFYQGDWEEAKRQTAFFKKVPRNNSGLSKAIQIAKQYIN